ncbi:MAG TPA: hypothetical protein VHM48_14845 [Candidatus Limnocylindrales bacterium]|nr:hypothetical protein [Candidatus Limnocylindrales bacterium]
MSAPSRTSTAAGGGSASARPGAPRDPDLILARVHLLLGSLSLARTELETLAGRGVLDDEAIRDLAEARWRTGDVLGAGEAATEWLVAHPDDVLGLVIAAEAQATLGRPGEARRLAGRAMERADGSLDPVFAGMQRSPIWPVEPGSSVGPVGVLFDDLHPGPQAVDPLPPPLDGRSGGFGTFPDDDPDALPGSAVPIAPATGPSLWGDEAAGRAVTSADALDPTTLFHQARVALEAGQAAEAATGLILALRASPGLAPAVLDLLAGRSDSILALVRGDAQRIVGREVEAMRDHAAAAEGLAAGDTTDDESGSARPVAADADVDTDPTDPAQEDS